MTDQALCLKLQNISYQYETQQAVFQNLNLNIAWGTRLVLLGANGVGKSTLFSLISGLFKPRQGTISWAGQPYDYSRSFLNRLRKNVGYVFQNPDEQLFAGTVLDDVLFGPMNSGLSLSEALKKAQQSLEQVEMADYAERPVHQLSQGQKKRVALAGILAMDPQILLLDEPTAGLDALGIAELTKLLLDLNQQGKTLLVATHDTDWAWEWAQEAVVLYEKNLVLAGKAQTVLSHANHAQWGYHKPLAAALREALLLRDGKVLGEGVQQLLKQVAVKN